jgi:sodium-dependent dicarboxylate transporter 2/3/5
MTTDDPGEVSAPSHLQYASIVLALTCLAYGVFATPPTGLSRTGLLALGVFGFGLILWQSKAIPLVATGLLVVGLLYALGITESFREATSGFSSTLFFFFFTILTLGHSISKVGLDMRVARRLLATSSTPRASHRQLGKYVLLLSFVMPSGLARMVAFTPIIDEVRNMYGLDRESSFATSSFLLLGQLNPIASMSLMTGGGLSIIGAQLVHTAGYSIDWVGWAVYMLPPTVFIYVLGFLAVAWLHPPTGGNHSEDLSRYTRSVESLTRPQRAVIVVMGGTLFAWAVSSFLELPTLLPAIVAVGLLSAPPARVLGPEDFSTISWGILFLVGSMLSLIEALEATGTFEWLIEAVSSVVPFDAFGAPTAVAILLAIVVGMRLFFPTGSTCLIVMVPIVISFGRTYDLNVLYLSLSTVLLVGSTVLVPLHLPPSLLAYNRGFVDTREVFVYGLCTLAFAVISVCLAWSLYWPLVETYIT